MGDLRFAAPVAPTGRNPVVQDGRFSPICPQAAPAWSPIGGQFVNAFAQGNASSFDYAAAVAQLQAAAAQAPPYMPSPQETEDCLFLDVIVPKSIFDNRNNRYKRHDKAGAPVLLWIYGGGYTFGSKQQGGFYNPSGLINASLANGGQGVVYVAINYRLGALGWLSGPTMQSQGGVANAALYDQRLAIKWVKDNIRQFGGDPNQITLIGESAGGGSIMHQITAFGGQQPVDFQRAIPQSPGWFPLTNNAKQDNNTARFFANLNVTSLAAARSASTAALQRANLLTVAAADYGQYVFGPAVDGVFVTAQPGVSLLSTSPQVNTFAHNVAIMAGHNSNEGVAFTPPYIKTDEQLGTFLRANYPGLTPGVLAQVLALYPQVYDGSYGYTSPILRTIQMVSEQIFTCNTNYLAKAYNNRTYAYQFEIFPAVHALDLYSTFYQGQPTDLTTGIYAPVANALQTYLTNFAMTGNPNTPSLMDRTSMALPNFPQQGYPAMQLGLNYSITAQGVVPDITAQMDPTSNPRCAFWQKALYQ